MQVSALQALRFSPQRYLNCVFEILRVFILDRRVDDGIPSLAAAPPGPSTRPLLQARAASMIFRSSPRSSSDDRRLNWNGAFRRCTRQQRLVQAENLT